MGRRTNSLLLASIASTTQPQAAYIAFVVGYRQKFNYVFRTMKDLDDFLTPLQSNLKAQQSWSEMERKSDKKHHEIIYRDIVPTLASTERSLYCSPRILYEVWMANEEPTNK